MINALQNIWNLDSNSLHAPVHQCVLYTTIGLVFYFFLCELLTQIFDVRMPSFL